MKLTSTRCQVKHLYKNTLAVIGNLRLVEFGKHSNRPYGVLRELTNDETEVALFDDLFSAMVWYENLVPSQLKRGAK